MKKIFLGPPGSGKGTYSQRIAPLLGIPHISTGDLFREHLKNETHIGKKVKVFLESGKLVPDDIVLEVVKIRISQEDCKKGFILDGFPRTIYQAEKLFEITDIDIVTNLVIPEDILIEKICSRRSCKECGFIYNLAEINREGIHMPPMHPKIPGKCDKCQGKLIQRKDDCEEIIKERLEVYKKEIQPLIEFYKNKGILKDIKIIGSPEVMVEIILKELERFN
ncbi:MAG: adenylate kinase [Candidatus Pacearchaeota archaeon]|jgi:adenylate kinase